MDIKNITESLKNCPCGRLHEADIKAVEIEAGITPLTGEILNKNGFPKKVLLVADKNTLGASAGISESLHSVGYAYETLLYDDLKIAEMKEVNRIERLLLGFEGCLSVGTGSLNDICRLAAFRAGKPLAIFATAPSMDGFASDSSPIIDNGFKKSYQARQPEIIIADTEILAAAPAVLKSAGFGDMIGKIIALVDWKISHLICGEYYCERIAGFTQNALNKMISIAPKVQSNDVNTAKLIMESLVLTGVAMQYAKSVRPASGAEHVLSHFWEVKKLDENLTSDYHGRKVGVATVLINRLYKDTVCNNEVFAHSENVDWSEVYEAYGKSLAEEVKMMNMPSIADEIDPKSIEENWPEIQKIINNGLMENEKLVSLMKSAGAATEPNEIDVDDKLVELGLKYHSFMRRRLTLARLLPMVQWGNKEGVK